MLGRGSLTRNVAMKPGGLSARNNPTSTLKGATGQSRNTMDIGTTGNNLSLGAAVQRLNTNATKTARNTNSELKDRSMRQTRDPKTAGRSQEPALKTSRSNDNQFLRMNTS